MNKYLKLYESHSQYMEPTIKPNVSYCIAENEVHYNPHTFADEYFTTVAREDGTISFNIWYSIGTGMITSISYSTDNGETWTTTNNTDNKSEHLVITVNVNNGDKVMWKGDAKQLGYYDSIDYADALGSFFSSTCEFDAQGNVMSLLYGDNYKNQTTIEEVGGFCNLFYDYSEKKTCGIVNAKNLFLPATTLAKSCYRYMFFNCTNLTTTPELPATTLAQSCYNNMFTNCTSLTTAPKLPATTLASDCYDHMFYGCTNLTTVSNLPATTLADGCYDFMFWGCTNLNYIKCLATDISASNCTRNWVQGVASSGTFTKSASMNDWTTGINGIPTGWTVETANN